MAVYICLYIHVHAFRTYLDFGTQRIRNKHCMIVQIVRGFFMFSVFSSVECMRVDWLHCLDMGGISCLAVFVTTRAAYVIRGNICVNAGM